MLAGRSRRRCIAAFLTLALLFMQWSVASYACPRPVASAMPCEGHAVAQMDPERGVLCKAHCTSDAQQVAADMPLPPVLALVGTGLAGVLDLAGAEGIASAMPAALAPGPPAGAPPLYIALQVLRN